MDQHVRFLAMTQFHTPLLCEVGAGSLSKPYACFAAGSLLGSANRGRQREPAGWWREKELSSLQSNAFQQRSGLTASRQQQHLFLQQQFNPVCRLLTPAKATFLHLTLETPALPTWRVLRNQTHWSPLPWAAAPPAPPPRVSVLTPNFLPVLPLG